MKYLSRITYVAPYLVVVLLSPGGRVTGKAWGTAQKEKKTTKDGDGYSLLVEWMRSHGGRVDGRMTIADVDGIRGAVALEDLEEDTELLYCPWKLVIGSSSLADQMTSEDDMCQVVKLMASEFRLGDQSVVWPYLSHIELPRLADMWGALAVDELQGLPPATETNRHRTWFSRNCGGGGEDDLDAATMQALVSFISRASAVGMIPIYDLLNHHNGLKNAKLFLSGEGVHLRTVKAIPLGQQIFLSYGLKASSQMYRDYGFVESWPSLWSWRDASTDDNHVFALFQDGIAAIHPSAEFLKEIWNAPPRSELECQQSATHYTQSLSPDALIRFSTAAKYLLDGLPTTLQEDEAIMTERKGLYNKQTTVLMEGDESILALADAIQAIQYRMTFKKAVTEALSFSEESLAKELLDKEEL